MRLGKTGTELFSDNTLPVVANGQGAAHKSAANHVMDEDGIRSNRGEHQQPTV